MHHIIADGLSVSILLRDLDGLYRGAPLPEASSTDPEVAIVDDAIVRILSNRAPLLREAARVALPGTGTPSQSGRARRVRRGTGPELMRDLQALAEGSDCTLFMALLAAFQTLLFRRSGRREISVGVPFSNRATAETNDAVGLFANLVPVAGRLDPAWSTLALLQAVRTRVHDAMAIESLPFAEVVRHVFPAKDSDRNGLFSSMFVAFDDTMTHLTLDGLSVAEIDVPMPDAKHDLLVEARAGPAGLWITIEYDAGRLTPSEAQAMLDQFMALLAAMTADPTERIDRISLGPARFRPPVPRAAELSGGDTLHGRLDRRAVERTDAIAVAGPDCQLSYAALARLSENLSGHLRRAGIGPEEIVALYGPRNVDLIVGLFGILKAGAAYLPLDPDHPAQRRAQIVGDARPAAIVDLSAAPTRHDYPGTDLPIFTLSDALAPPDPAAVPDVPTASSQNLAYVIYTSGSTGRPKGVLVTHANVLHLLDATAPGFRLTCDDRWVMFHSLAFDFSVWEVFGALSTGARLDIVPGGIVRDATTFHRFAAQRDPTVLNQTPSAFAALDRTDAALQGPAPNPRLIVFGGEPLPAALVRSWHDRKENGAGRMVNMYGITETTVHVTETPPGPLKTVRGGSWIGNPTRCAGLHVLDPAQNEVPEGCVGEFHVTGTGLARGYLDRPGMTAERFLPDPMSPVPGGRMYRTGDLGRRESDGSLTYLGRADSQVNLRGYRIELGEIEQTLAQCPDVRDALVSVRDTGAAATLVAYVVGTDGLLDAGTLRAFCSRHLPGHMVPAQFFAVRSLPRTPNGKIDRAVLPEAQPLPEHRNTEPVDVSELEALVATIWETLLGTAPIRPDDHFFASGGHSLLVPAVADAVLQATGRPVPLAWVFETPVLSEFCARLAAGVDGSADLSNIGSAGARESFPLSHDQRDLLAADALQGESSAALTMSEADFLSGPLDRGRLADVLSEVARRHGALRTRLDFDAAKPAQRLAPRGAPMRCVDLSALPRARRAPLARAILSRSLRRRFDLRGPLWSTSLLCLSSHRHILLRQAHHAIADGPSLALVDAAIGAAWNGTRAPIAELRYVDVAVRQTATRPVVEHRPASELSAVAAGAQATRRRLSDPQRTALRTLAASRNATGFMVFAAATAASLMRRTGRLAVHLGIPVSRRYRPALRDLVGPLVTRSVFQLQVEPDKSFAQLLSETRRAVLDAVLTQGATGAAHAPDVMISAEPDDRRLCIDGLHSRRLRLAPQHLLYPLTLMLQPASGTLIAYHRLDAGPAVAVEELLDDIVAVLSAASSDPNTKLIDLASGNRCSEGRMSTAVVDSVV